MAEAAAGGGRAPARATWPERLVDRVPFLAKELFLLHRLVARDEVCVDVGAAGGAHLLVMARRVGPGGRVLGVEPRSGSWRVLRVLARLLGLAGRVRLVRVALGGHAGVVQLRIPVVPTRAHVRGHGRGPVRLAAFGRLPARHVRVPLRRLDDLVAAAGLERLDVLKIDVEGAELAVLAGGVRVLSELRPVVLVEAEDRHQARASATAAEVLAAVVAHDYRAHRWCAGRLEAVGGPVDGEDDYVLVPAERLADVERRLAAAERRRGGLRALRAVGRRRPRRAP